MTKRYRITTTATVVFLSDTLEWMGDKASPDFARGQFLDTARDHNKHAHEYLIYPDFAGAMVQVVNDEGEIICDETGLAESECKCWSHAPR